MADRLFPVLPEDLAAASDDTITELLADHEAAIEKINADDEEFLKGLSADEIISQLKEGVEQVKSLRAENGARLEAHENYVSERAKLTAELEVVADAETEDEDEGDGDGEGSETEAAEVVAEAEEITEEASDTRELVTAAVQPNVTVRLSRTPPPAPERIVPSEPEIPGAALVASGGYRQNYDGPLNAQSLAELQKSVIDEYGPAPREDAAPGRYVTKGPHGDVIWDGPRVKTARQEVTFPSDRELTGDPILDIEKIRNAMPEYVTYMGEKGGLGGQALTASGGLCAPLTPIYSMPNFATEAEPVWDSLPVFRAARGGVNVPTATYIADITSAISSISEENDALGGTFATKSCQDLDCPDYTETAVQIFAHCREYGNLNARAWPEKIAHENALTMAALSRTGEGFMLDRIKSFFPNVTNGATTLGLTIYLVEAIVRARFGILGRFRMPRETRFRALLPYWLPDVLQLDNISTQFDRFRSKDELVGYLRSVGIDPVFYLDTPSTGTTQLPDASQTAAAIDSTPATIQWAIYPEGAVLGVDMGTLELGIVRDSTLNRTNDFQVFGERFRNVALIAPAQAGMWVTTTYCAQGSFPPAGTARTCP